MSTPCRLPSNDCPFVQADLADFGQAFEVLSEIDDRIRGVDARRPPGGDPCARPVPERRDLSRSTCSAPTTSSRRRGGLKSSNVVWASSETLLGLPFDTPPPYAPVDEDYPARPESAYSLSKLLGEEMAKQFAAGTRS